MNKLEDDEIELEPNEFSELGSIPLTDETISQDQINEMKMLGMARPETVSSERWWRIQDVRYEHEFMIHMAASGVPQKKIALELGYADAHVSKVLSTPEVRKQVQDQINEIYGSDIKKALKDRALKAISVVDDVLVSDKESERASMAKYVLDHTVGKASQDIQVTKTTLSEFIIQINDMQSNQLRDVNPNSEVLPKVKDHFDTIIEQVIPSGMVIGKRSGGSSEGETK